jgi:hypothetical protein
MSSSLKGLVYPIRMNVRDFCGSGLWTVMDSAGFFSNEFRQTVLKSLSFLPKLASVNH